MEYVILRKLEYFREGKSEKHVRDIRGILEVSPGARGDARGDTRRGRRNLLTIYQTRFGAVPRKVPAAVECTRDDAALARWVEIFVARSAAEIAATVTEKKA